MRPTDIRRMLTAEPFVPFRITLSTGATYDVLHPELVMVGFTSMVIGLTPPGNNEPIYDHHVTVALVHVVQMEPLTTVPS